MLVSMRPRSREREFPPAWLWPHSPGGPSAGTALPRYLKPKDSKALCGEQGGLSHPVFSPCREELWQPESRPPSLPHQCGPSFHPAPVPFSCSWLLCFPSFLILSLACLPPRNIYFLNECLDHNSKPQIVIFLQKVHSGFQADSRTISKRQKGTQTKPPSNLRFQ